MRAATALFAVLALLATTSFLAGCIPVVVDEGGKMTLAATQKHPEPAAEATGASGPSMVGSQLSAGSWQVTVVRARTSSKGPGGAKAGAGKAFLLIDTVFKNTQMSETLVVSPKMASLTSSSGKKVAEWGTISGYNGRGMRGIGPGYGGNTTFVYRIPKGSSGYVFTFAPKVGGKREKLQWAVP
jgi:hypothetical protein